MTEYVLHLYFGKKKGHFNTLVKKMDIIIVKLVKNVTGYIQNLKIQFSLLGL